MSEKFNYKTYSEAVHSCKRNCFYKTLLKHLIWTFSGDLFFLSKFKTIHPFTHFFYAASSKAQGYGESSNQIAKIHFLKITRSIREWNQLQVKWNWKVWLWSLAELDSSETEFTYSVQMSLSAWILETANSWFCSRLCRCHKWRFGPEREGTEKWLWGGWDGGKVKRGGKVHGCLEKSYLQLRFQ